MTKKVLFVCTGNYYRSCFAEIYFNYCAKQKGLLWKASSRGFRIDNPNNTGSVSPHTKKLLLSLHVPIPNHEPTKIDTQDIMESNIIIGMDKKEHVVFVNKYFPKFQKKFIFWNVQDVQSFDPKKALFRLKLNVEFLIENLNNLKTESKL